MELPRGITGFRHVNDPPLPVSDFAVFRGNCYAAARTLGGRVQSHEAPTRSVSASFAHAVLDVQGASIAIMLNSQVPMIAFADPPVENMPPVRFAHHPALAELFQSFGTYEVWSVTELEVSLTPENCKLLSRAELEQVKYWRPRRVGDVVFNFWD